jgi:hypothetical protein
MPKRNDPDERALEPWRTCAAEGCNNTFPAVTKPWGGGTARKRWCCAECQQREYRTRRRQRLHAKTNAR